MTLPPFYPILDTATAQDRDIHPVTMAGEILAGGARILQFRHKDFLSRQAYEWLEEIAEFTEEAKALLVVNDRADLAKLFNAALHLGQDDLPPEAARSITGKSTIIGFSTHNETQLRAAASEPVDYFALGPIFGTTTKANPDATVGIAELRRLRPLTNKPLVAIGSITLANALEVRDAGADSVAVVAGLFPEDGNIRKRAQEWVKLLG